MQVSMEPTPSRSRSRIWPVAIFLAILVLGVFYAKWEPYYFKTLTAASTHSIGHSIVTGTSNRAPAISWQAAWQYGLAYFKDIWVALLVGLLVGAGVQTLLPASWLYRVFGRVSAKGRLWAILAAIPSMMCTCCSAPIVVGMKRQHLSNGAALGYWLANPLLNPATIIFMGFVLGWNWALLRIVVGALLVVGASWLGDRTADSAAQASFAGPPPAEEPPTVAKFLRQFGLLVVRLLPEYVVIVLLLGALRAWLFPAMNAGIGGSWWLVLVFAIVGTLFVIPTAGEVPIVQTLMHFGLGLAPAGTLMITLPAVSLPSMAMVGQQMGVKVVAKVAVLVAVTGVITGVLAHWLL
ncbi:MAG: permease [Firmicutes bacterium]|nr:permease [Bacillota bacterium]